MSTETGANKNRAIFLLLFFGFVFFCLVVRLLKPSLPFHLLISNFSHGVGSGQEEVQREYGGIREPSGLLPLTSLLIPQTLCNVQLARPLAAKGSYLSANGLAEQGVKGRRLARVLKENSRPKQQRERRIWGVKGERVEGRRTKNSRQSYPALSWLPLSL